MKEGEKERKEDFVEPKVLASYKREELEEIIEPHAMPNGDGGCGCGCS